MAGGLAIARAPLDRAEESIRQLRGVRRVHGHVPVHDRRAPALDLREDLGVAGAALGEVLGVEQELRDVLARAPHEQVGILSQLHPRIGQISAGREYRRIVRTPEAGERGVPARRGGVVQAQRDDGRPGDVFQGARFVPGTTGEILRRERCVSLGPEVQPDVETGGREVSDDALVDGRSGIVEIARRHDAVRRRDPERRLDLARADRRRGIDVHVVPQDQGTVPLVVADGRDRAHGTGELEESAQVVETEGPAKRIHDDAPVWTSMRSPVVGIHQPNFFPWLGFFDKLARSDVFVLMDEVQFPRSGAGNWVNRVSVLVDGAPHWLTAPVVRAHGGTRTIAETEISDAAPWRERTVALLRHSYAKAPHFNEAMDLIGPLVLQRTSSLCEYNSTAIRAIAEAVGSSRPRIVPMSSLRHSGHATDLLISLVQAVGGGTYLCGGGSAGYLEEEKFPAHGIELVYQGFRHPVYPQRRATEFVPGLSIVDALMNCGVAGTRDLIVRTEDS